MININVDVDQKGEKYNPLWKKLITAGRAAEGLREDWRNQLRETQKEIGFEYIRFHGIFHDDMMIYNVSDDGTVVYNWQYLDILFDFLLEIGLRPFVELGFMPAELASGEKTIFWWKGNITPPKDYSRWSDLVYEMIRHCVNRYGLAEVLQWYFEVWNEPNCHFWTGSQEDYFKLYKYSALAVKSIDHRLKVGGPASSFCLWVEDFLKYCENQSVPVDFVSTHIYACNWALDNDGSEALKYPDKDKSYTDMKWLYNTVKNSAFKDAEIHLTEWNSSSTPRDLVHDTAFMAPFVIHNNIRCLDLADSLGFWTFTDIFEEIAASETIFHGGFGLINALGLKKPGYYGYWFLSKLGDEKLEVSDNFIVTRRNDKIQILAWNYCHYNTEISNGNRSSLTKYDRYSAFDEKDMVLKLNINGMISDYRKICYEFGREKGSVFDLWLANGADAFPTKEECDIIRKKMGPEGTIKSIGKTDEYNMEILLKPHDIVFFELQKQI